VFVPIALASPALSALLFTPLLAYLVPVAQTTGRPWELVPYLAIAVLEFDPGRADNALMDAQIRGTTMPVLEVRLDPGESVIAESGELGWMSETIELETSTAFGGADGVLDAAKRSFGGASFFMTRYSATTAPGFVCFPVKVPGQIFQVPLGPDHEYVIHRHGFLAGTTGCELATAFSPDKLGSGLLGGFGFLLQRLTGTGHAWIELSGELTEYALQPGQTVRVHPGHVGMLEGTVAYELTTVPGIKNKVFGGDGLFLLRLTGPGKVWLQSLSLPALAHALAPFLPAQQNGGGSVGSVTAAGGVAAAVGGIAGLLG